MFPCNTTALLHAHEPHCYTRFNTLQLSAHTYFRTPGIGRTQSYAQSLIGLPLTHYTFACSHQYNDLLTVFQPLLRTRLRHPALLAYPSGGVHLPAYSNDVMKEYKATTHLRSGRNFGILCRRG